MAAPVLLVHLYTERALDRMLPRFGQQPLPADTAVFLGTYGINRGEATKIKAVTGDRAGYAPTFHLAPADNKDVRKGRGRSVPPTLQPEFAGPFPAPERQRLPNPDKPARGWGLELGRRFRDQLRIKSRQFTIHSWQLDEIYGECRFNTAEGKRYRQFSAGVVRGIAEGRPELGDELLPGFVWIARTAMTALPGFGLGPEMQQFWEDVHIGAKHLVGEEYPEFAGSAQNARNVGTSYADPHRRLAQLANPHCKSLAHSYVVGMSPGWKLRAGLGGNTRGKTPQQVTEWRSQFIVGRIKAQKPAGYGQFSFDHDNVLPGERVDDAIDSLHFAAATHVTP